MGEDRDEDAGYGYGGEAAEPESELISKSGPAFAGRGLRERGRQEAVGEMRICPSYQDRAEGDRETDISGSEAMGESGPRALREIVGGD